MGISLSLLAVFTLDAHHDRLLAIVADVRLISLDCESEESVCVCVSVCMCGVIFMAYAQRYNMTLKMIKKPYQLSQNKAKRPNVYLHVHSHTIHTHKWSTSTSLHTINNTC